MTDGRQAIAMALLVALVGGCAAGAPTSAPPSPSAVATPSPTAIAAPSASPSSAASLTPAPSPSTTGDFGTGCSSTGPAHHDAPELEATLPSKVGGKTLARWSVVGRCWLDLALTGSASPPEIFLDQADTIDPGRRIDVSHLRYAVAGRSDVANDPPYFVFAAYRSPSEEEIQVALILMLGGAGYTDVQSGIDLRSYEKRTIAGRTVHVGTPAMIQQTEHVRGRPYLYQTNDAMYVVITEQDAWAAEALGKLPKG